MISRYHAAVICIGGAGKAVARMLRDIRCKADIFTADTHDADFTSAKDAGRFTAVVKRYRFIYIVSAMGGRAGSTFAPMAARICSWNGIDFTVGAVIPFSFESRGPDAQACLSAIRCYGDPVMFFNDRTLSTPDITLDDALKAVNMQVCCDIVCKVSMRMAPLRRNTVASPGAVANRSVSAPQRYVSFPRNRGITDGDPRRKHGYPPLGAARPWALLLVLPKPYYK